MPARHREAWNEEDIATLRRGFGRRAPVPVIARELERSQEAVTRKAQQLGLIERKRRPSPPAKPSRHLAGNRYRVTVFGEPRSEWAETPEAARQDAISLGLASWDAEARQWFLAVPVAIETGGLGEGSSQDQRSKGFLTSKATAKTVMSS